MAERLTLEAAAARLGVSVRTVRRRIKSGLLSAEREETPQGFRYYVTLDLGTSTDDTTATVTPPTDETALVAQLTGERDWLRQLVEEQQRTIAGLSTQLERAQVLIGQAQEIARLPAPGQSSGEAAGPSTGHDVMASTPAASQHVRMPTTARRGALAALRQWLGIRGGGRR